MCCGGGMSSQGSGRKTKRRRRVSRRRGRQLLEAMAEADQSPRDLAESMNMSLTDLIEWAAEPANARRLASLARLSDVHTQMVVSRYRASAAVQLIKLATSKDGGEVARKACVDLLRTEMSAFDEPGRDDDRRAEPAVDTGRVLEALERLGGSTS